MESVTRSVDVLVVGAGIVGLAVARALLERIPRLKLVVLEKEPEIASHQSGHNSGVVHSGIYYKPGSLKAQLCLSGSKRLKHYCAERSIPLQAVGKVIVAVTPDEIARLDLLYQRGFENQVEGLELLDRARLAEIEPHAGGIKAIYSPGTSIVDFRQVANEFSRDVAAQNGEVITRARVLSIRQDGNRLRVSSLNGEYSARYLINCAGLYCDKIAQLGGARPDVCIVPFRGEYYNLSPSSQHLVRGLIYPVADPRLPFLGVHLTRTIDGRVEAGPNAVWAFAREGYSWGRVSPGELLTTLTFPGFWRLARRWWRIGAFEMYRSLNKAIFVRSLQTLVPEISGDDLVSGGAGVRAQAVNRNGELVDDFCFVESPNALHVLNAPSPAATASLEIADYIARRVLASSALN